MSFLDFNLHLRKNNLWKWLFLKSLSLVYGVLISCWLFLYRSGFKKAYLPGKPLISVGNITLGGTGKTPMIDWLLGICKKKGLIPVVLTRGYKAERQSDFQILDKTSAQQGNRRQWGDEPWLLYQRHPDTTFYIAPDRVMAAKKAAPSADVMLLDDGMQHLRISRTLNIVLIDSLSGIGNGRLFPLGPLREPLSSLARADIIVYTRTNLTNNQTLVETIQPYLNPETPQFRARFLPDDLVSSQQVSPLPASALSGKTCVLFSGIGNPASFALTLEQMGANVRDHLIFGDHSDYNAAELEKLKTFLKTGNFDVAICTEKDWVKLEAHSHLLPEFWYLRMSLSVDRELEDYLVRFLKTECG